jgi:hypothetical protein
MLFALIVPVGLVHGAARAADRSEGAAWLVGSGVRRLGVLLLVHFLGGQVRIETVALVLEHQRLGAVAHHNPAAVIDSHFRHICLWIPAASNAAFAPPG